MCTASFASMFNKLPGSKLREKISVKDPASKALGYEGLADPLGDYMHRRAGTKSKLMQKQDSLRDSRALSARTAEGYDGGTHVRSIAAHKARTGRS